MILFISSAIIVGTVAALLFLALHRLNQAMTQRALSGIVPRTPETAAGHLWAFSDAGAHGGPDLAAWGHPGALRPQTAYREYASSVPRVTRGSTTVRTYRKNRLGPGPAIGRGGGNRQHDAAQRTESRERSARPARPSGQHRR